MPKNTSKIRSWDQISFFRKGTVKVTGKPNPYKKRTLEGCLVDYTMTMDGQFISSDNSFLLLDYIKEKKMVASFDSWSFSNLMDRALWLSLNAGCITFINPFVKNRSKKNFGIYLQSGLLDLFHEPQYLDKLLQEAPCLDKTRHLYQVAYIAHILKEKWHLPIMRKTNQSISIENYESWMLERSESIALLPMSSWANSNPAYVSAKTRGIFHHLGDEMAFICAAIQYGDCYILGNDEFGDLMVLGVVPQYQSIKSHFSLGQICSAMDFDYIYSIPVSNALYPAQRNSLFNYSSESYDQCLINNRENAALSDSYWNNPYFLSQAKRNIQTYSLEGFSALLMSDIERTLSQEDYSEYQILLSQDTLSRLWIIMDLFYQRRIFSPAQEEDSFWQFLQEDKEFYFSHELADTIKHRISDAISPKSLENIFSYLLPVFAKMQKLAKKYDRQIEKKFSYFYKTSSHKVHCDIINPPRMDSHGFFLKDGDSFNIQKINLSSIFRFMFSHRQNTVFTSQYTIYYYKKKMKNINFNSIHKMYLKESIYTQGTSELKHLVEYWDAINHPAFVVSDVIDMQNEYRIFIINGRPVAGGPCFRNTTPFNAWDNGRFDPRLCDGHSAYDYYYDKSTRKRVAAYARFARKFAREIAVDYPQYQNFVLDVAYSEDKQSVVPIEVNSITWSGAYQIDLRRVCAGVAQVPYKKSSLNSYGRYDELLLEADEAIKEKWNIMKAKKMTGEIYVQEDDE